MALHSISAGVFGIFKWPIAILSILFLPAFSAVMLETVKANLFSLRWLLFGALAYYLFWRVVLRRIRNEWFSTLEHELTHCLFAIAMGNKVTGMRVTAREGGHMQYVGTSSWLIDISPYFFPTITLLTLIILPWVPQISLSGTFFIVGVTIAYHLTSTWVETHSGQSDLKKAGFFFSFLFLPSANIACFNIVMNVVLYGWDGFVYWYVAVLNSNFSPIILF